MSYVYCGWLDSALKWILSNIISPVFNYIKSVLGSVFSFIYTNVLGPVLDNTVYALGRWIWKQYLNMFFHALYAAAKYILQILDCLADLFDTLLGVQPVIFKGEETTLLRAFLSMDAVRKAFWYINFFALGLAVIFAIYGVTRSMLDFDFENKRPVSRVMSSLLSSVLNLFTVQLAVFGIIYLAEAILTGLNSAMALAGGATGNTTLGRMIFVLGTLNACVDEHFNLSYEGAQSGKVEVGPSDFIRKQFFESGGKNPYKLSDVQEFFDIYKLDYVVLIVIGAVFSFLLLLALVAVVRRLFNLLLLYIVSPLFAATIPLDDGERFGKWRNLFVGTCFTGYGMLVAMKLYLLICPMIMGSQLKISKSLELDFVCRVVFLLGGLWAVYKSSTMITGLISSEAAGAESESMSAAYALAKWTYSTMRDHAEGKAEEIRKRAEEQSEKEGQNGKAGEGSQRFNGRNTGAAGTGDHGRDNAFLGDMRKRNDKLEGAGKKDNKNKNSNLFQGKSKPGQTGKLGAENRTLDKLRAKFDMDNADDLDQEKKPEAEQNKNKNAFQGRKGRTTDSLGLGTGKNKKSMDALRSKLGFDTAAPEAADANEDEQMLGGKNKAAAAKASGQKNKLEGTAPDGKTAGGVAAGGRKAKDDSGYMESHLDLNALDKESNGGKFANGQRGVYNADFVGKNRPTLDDGSWKDTGKTANNAVDQTAPAEGAVASGATPNKGNVFAGGQTVGTGRFGGKNQGLDNADLGEKSRPSLEAAFTEGVGTTNGGNNTLEKGEQSNTFSGVTQGIGSKTTQKPDVKNTDMDMGGSGNAFTDTNVATNIPKSDTVKIQGSEPGFGVGSNSGSMSSNGMKDTIGVDASNASQGFEQTVKSNVGASNNVNMGGNVAVTGDNGNVFTDTNAVSIKSAETGSKNVAGGEVNVPKNDNGTSIPKVNTVQMEGSGTGFEARSNSVNMSSNGMKDTIGVDATNAPQSFGQTVKSNVGASNNVNMGGNVFQNDIGGSKVAASSEGQIPGSNEQQYGTVDTNQHDTIGTGSNTTQSDATGSTVEQKYGAAAQGFVQNPTSSAAGSSGTDINIGQPSAASTQTFGSSNPASLNASRMDATNNTSNVINNVTQQNQTFHAGSSNTSYTSSVNAGQQTFGSSNPASSNVSEMDVTNNTSNVNNTQNNYSDTQQYINNDVNSTVMRSNISQSSIQNNNVTEQNQTFTSEQNIRTNSLNQHDTINVEQSGTGYTGGGSYASDDSNINYGSRGMDDYRGRAGFYDIGNDQPSFATDNRGYTENGKFEDNSIFTNTNVREMQSNTYGNVSDSTAFHQEMRSENTVETEVNDVRMETKKIREESKPEQNDKKKDEK